jgi:hypothetical protein
MSMGRPAQAAAADPAGLARGGREAAESRCCGLEH